MAFVSNTRAHSATASSSLKNNQKTKTVPSSLFTFSLLFVLLVSSVSAGGMTQETITESATIFDSRKLCQKNKVSPLPAKTYQPADYSVFWTEINNNEEWDALISFCFKWEDNSFKLKDDSSCNAVLVQSSEAIWPVSARTLNYAYDNSVGQYIVFRQTINDICAYGCHNNHGFSIDTCAAISATSSNTVCSERGLTRKHRKDEDESQETSQATHLERRENGAKVNWASLSTIYFKATVTAGLCFVTPQDLLNYPTALDSNNNLVKMTDKYPCGNNRGLSKCSIRGNVSVGSISNTTLISYACYHIDKNVNFDGASSCRMIKKLHGPADRLIDTFISGFTTYMVPNPWLWRSCWTYPGQATFEGQSMPITDIFVAGGLNQGATTVGYRVSSGSYFRNYGCLSDLDGGRSTTGFDNGTYRVLRNQITDPSFGVNGASMTMTKCLYAGYLQGWNYCGVYGLNTCMCDNMVNPLVPIEKGYCMAVCPGSSSERCASAWSINVYQINRQDSKQSQVRDLPNLIKNGTFSNACVSNSCTSASGTYGAWSVRNQAGTANDVIQFSLFNPSIPGDFAIEQSTPFRINQTVSITVGNWYLFSLIMHENTTRPYTKYGTVTLTQGTNVITIPLRHTQPQGNLMAGRKFKATASSISIDIFGNATSLGLKIDNITLVKLGRTTLNGVEDGVFPFLASNLAEGDTIDCFGDGSYYRFNSFAYSNSVNGTITQFLNKYTNSSVAASWSSTWDQNILSVDCAANWGSTPSAYIGDNLLYYVSADYCESSENLLLNGDFEATENVPAWTNCNGTTLGCTFPQNGNALSWTVTSSPASLTDNSMVGCKLRTLSPPSYSSYVAVLWNAGCAGKALRISQAVPTIPGVVYSLSYLLGISGWTEQNLSGILTVRLTSGASTSVQNFNVTSLIVKNYTTAFTAGDYQTTIEFWGSSYSANNMGFILDNIAFTRSSSVVGSFRDPVTDVIKSGLTNNICLTNSGTQVTKGTNLIQNGGFEINNCFDSTNGAVVTYISSKKLCVNSAVLGSGDQFVPTWSFSAVNGSGSIIDPLLVGISAYAGTWIAKLASNGSPASVSQELNLRSGTYTFSFALNFARGVALSVPSVTYLVSIENGAGISGTVTYNTALGTTWSVFSRNFTVSPVAPALTSAIVVTIEGVDNAQSCGTNWNCGTVIDGVTVVQVA